MMSAKAIKLQQYYCFTDIKTTMKQVQLLLLSLQEEALSVCLLMNTVMVLLKYPWLKEDMLTTRPTLHLVQLTLTENMF